MEHDPLCPRTQNLQVLTACQCDLIRAVQERTREEVASMLYEWITGEDEDDD